MSNNDNQQPKGPLAGITVLDLSRILAGPTCTQLLGDLGADIIKVERPGTGDDTRKWGPPFVKDKHGNDTSESAYYLCANRNKRSVAIDMSKAEGATIIKKLAAKSDILIENFKFGGLKKYGLDYDSLKDQMPGLVYCSITGFGQTGPNRDKAGYDLMAQGYGGIMSLTGEPDGEPMKVAVGIADVVCGLYASNAILACLRHRDLTGEGQHIDLALVDSQISWLINSGSNYLISGKPPERLGNQHPNIVPYQVFEMADGHAIIATGNDAQYQRFCELIGREDLATDARYATNAKRLQHRDELLAILADELKKHNKAEFLAGMDARGIPAGPVNTLPEVYATDQVKARNMKISMPHPTSGTGEVTLTGNPLKLSKTPVSYDKAPPLLGQHSEEVLRDLLGDEEFEKAIKTGIVS